VAGAGGYFGGGYAGVEPERYGGMAEVVGAADGQGLDGVGG
jgi:hypothetical protein